MNPPECYFRDLGSRNGTYVNDERVDEKHLQDGDVISGGKTKIRISTISQHQEPFSSNATTHVPPTVDYKGSPPTSAPRGSEPMLIQPFPGYVLQDELGVGGMGVVYRAIQKSTSKQVALKLIMPAHSLSEDAMQLFIREANILSQLNHPRIVKFLEFGMIAGQLFLTMEYVDSIQFSSLLENQSQSSRVRIPCAIACRFDSHGNATSLPVSPVPAGSQDQ